MTSERTVILLEGDRVSWSDRNGKAVMATAATLPSGRGALVLDDGVHLFRVQDVAGSKGFRIVQKNTDNTAKIIDDMLKQDFIVVLNVAHSADTPGKRSPDGAFIEYNWSRDVCARIAERLKDYGFGVAVVEQPDRNGLDKAVVAINRLTHKRNALCVSIHVNAAGDGSRWYGATGWSAYTSVGTTKADTAARFLSRAAYGVLSPKGRSIRANSSDGVSNYERDFYVLRKTACPAVLTENFFQDNRDDVAYLLSEEGREDIVRLHVRGIIDYYQWLAKELAGSR